MVSSKKKKKTWRLHGKVMSIGRAYLPSSIMNGLMVQFFLDGYGIFEAKLMPLTGKER